MYGEKNANLRFSLWKKNSIAKSQEQNFPDFHETWHVPSLRKKFFHGNISRLWRCLSFKIFSLVPFSSYGKINGKTQIRSRQIFPGIKVDKYQNKILFFLFIKFGKFDQNTKISVKQPIFIIETNHLFSAGLRPAET